MTSVASTTKTGNAYVDGVLSGVRWGTTNLTVSFPTSSASYETGYGSGEPGSGFKALTPIQVAAANAALANYAAVSNLTFTIITEPTPPDTTSPHADIRYGSSSMPSTSWAYYPSPAPEGGDIWIGNSNSWYASPTVGTYAFATFLHETGHALGLKHPHEASGSFAALPVDKDSLEYSVMSYRSYVGGSTSGGYTNGSASYPQTLMMYDIAGVQAMYGANYTTNSGNTVYKWDPATGQMSINSALQTAPTANKVFMTIWDGGGNDTYDLSNYSTGVKIDLNPGGWTTTSTAQLASLGSGKVAVGNVANALLFQGNTASLIENAIGGAGADTLTGNTAANRLTGNGGNDTLDGGLGSDTAIFAGLSTQYTRTTNSDGSVTVTDTVSGRDGVDRVSNIEFLQFSDTTVSIGSTPTPPTPPTPPTVINVAPVAVSDSYSVAKNGRLSVVTGGVLANDTDTNGDHLSAVLVSRPSRGSLIFNSDGTFTYSPTRNFTGTVTFSYKATDGALSSAVTTVKIVVGGVATAKSNGIADDQMPAPAHADKVDLDHILGGKAGRAESPVTKFLNAFADNGPSGFHAGPSHGAAPALHGLPDFLNNHHVSDFLLG